MQDCDDSDILSVTTTVGSTEAAQALARETLDRRLAACAQIEQLASLYHWKGAVCEEPEVRVTFKTVPAAAPALQALFARAHPYELPQFLSCVMRASPAYAAWVRQETRLPPG